MMDHGMGTWYDRNEEAHGRLWEVDLVWSRFMSETRGLHKPEPG